MTDAEHGAVCGSNNPPVGSRVSLRRTLHDNGFGFCDLMVSGLYGNPLPRLFAYFSTSPGPLWRPEEQPERTLGWVEKRIKKWDEVWPAARWEVHIVWPWQSEWWTREAPGRWIVTESSARGIVD